MYEIYRLKVLLTSRTCRKNVNRTLWMIDYDAEEHLEAGRAETRRNHKNPCLAVKT